MKTKQERMENLQERMENLQERVKIAEIRVEESEGRRKRFMEKYQATGDKLSLELAQDEEKRIARIRMAISEAYIKLREGGIENEKI